MIEIRTIVASQEIINGKSGGLFEQHWRETEENVVSCGPGPMIDFYKASEEAGFIVAFGAFDGDEMVGYVTAFVTPHLHYGVLYGNHDTLFVRADLRNSRIGLSLINMATEECRARGALFMCWHAKPGTALDVILQRKKYVAEDITYRKEF